MVNVWYVGSERQALLRQTKLPRDRWLHADLCRAYRTVSYYSCTHRCEGRGILASSFFFDRDIPDRRSFQKLFSTIARDLVRFDDNFAAHISLILENDRSLASACRSRQFDKHILEPACRHRIGTPAVIVIDALDEGCDLETLEILRDQVPKLPGTFRFFVTSRPLDDVITDLSDPGHVYHREIDIRGEKNQRDIVVYFLDRLHYISSWRRLDPDWAGIQ